jgi:outer membrane protein TolC
VALQAYVEEVLARHPEGFRAQEAVHVEEAKIPQAYNLEDPVVTLETAREPDMNGEVREEMRRDGLMISQVLPWPGKRKLRETVARMEARGAEAANDRVRLGLRAEAKRTFLALLLAREQAVLLEEQDTLAAQAEASLRARFEAGQGTQAELLRAQLERTRLLQRRWALEAELKVRLANFNALKNRPAAEPFPTPFALESLPEPDEAAWSAFEADAESRSPEVVAAEAHLVHAQAAVHENRLNLRPDFVVSGGLMRTQGVGTGWKVGLGLSLPVFAATKQRKAIQQWEAEHRMHMGERSAAALQLRRAQAERRAQVEGLRKVLHLYREGLLVQSLATLEATLAHLESGRGSYLAALEAIRGLISDRGALLDTLAQLHAQAIAAEELNPGPTPPIPGINLGGAAMPSLGGSPGMAAGSAMPKKEGEAAPASSPMKSM